MHEDEGRKVTVMSAEVNTTAKAATLQMSWLLLLVLLLNLPNMHRQACAAPARLKNSSSRRRRRRRRRKRRRIQKRTGFHTHTEDLQQCQWF